MRVAMVHGPASPDRDGVSDYAARLIRELAALDIDTVSVVVRPRTAGRWWPATAAAADAVRRLRPDLVHVQFAPSAYRFSGSIGALPALLPRALPLVTTLHEYGSWARPAWLPAVLWRPAELLGVWDRETGRLVPASRALVVTNRGHARALSQRTRRTPVEIPIPPNVDSTAPPSDARRTVRQRLGLAPGCFLLVFFGFVHPVKGLRYLLEALPQVRAARPDLHLVAIGGFTSQALPQRQAREFRAQLESSCEQHAVADAVTFTGYLPPAQVSEILHAADAGVLPFTTGVTTKSGALLALLTHGVPTAVTVADQPDERLRDGETVAVIDRLRDPLAIATTVNRLVTDPALRQRLGTGGQRLLAGRSWRDVADAHRALYERVLGRAHG